MEVKDYWQNYIDGEFVDGGAGRLQVDNPGTGEALAEQAIYLITGALPSDGRPKQDVTSVNLSDLQSG